MLSVKPPSGPHPSAGKHVDDGGEGLVEAVAVGTGDVVADGDGVTDDDALGEGVPLPAESDGAVTVPPQARRKAPEKTTAAKRIMPSR